MAEQEWSKNFRLRHCATALSALLLLSCASGKDANEPVPDDSQATAAKQKDEVPAAGPRQDPPSSVQEERTTPQKSQQPSSTATQPQPASQRLLPDNDLPQKGEPEDEKIIPEIEVDVAIDPEGEDARSSEEDAGNSKTTKTGEPPSTPANASNATTGEEPASIKEGQEAGEQQAPLTEAIEAKQPLTPLDQSSKPSDIELTRDIRVAIVQDDSLSFDARNIKIITIDGIVTLRGLVRSTTEKQRVVDLARQVAGKDRVRERLTVAN